MLAVKINEIDDVSQIVQIDLKGIMLNIDGQPHGPIALYFNLKFAFGFIYRVYRQLSLALAREEADIDVAFVAVLVVGYFELIDCGLAVHLHFVFLLIVGVHVETYFLEVDVVLFY